MFVENLDEPAVPERPPPGRVGPLRPWIEWFGVGRLIAGALTVVLLVGAGWWLLRSPSPPTEAGLPLASVTAGSTTVASGGSAGAPPGPAPPTTAGPLVVHVAGAVASPGVYELAPGARVQAAVEAAGGAVPGADPGALNLAAPVGDGERVYVPMVGETVPIANGPPAVTVAPGPVDLNQASAAELDGLPGIGPATAAAIVEHREQNGPFASVEDLEAVRGIGPAKLDALRDLVRV
jgi:competence protein ComEA